jgi:hypothetical protein
MVNEAADLGRIGLKLILKISLHVFGNFSYEK